MVLLGGVTTATAFSAVFACFSFSLSAVPVVRILLRPLVTDESTDLLGRVLERFVRLLFVRLLFEFACCRFEMWEP